MDENKGLVETMEDYAEELEASFKRLHEGDIVTGTVVAVTDDQVLVDLKYFAQGVIDRENLSNDPDFNMKEEIQPGDLLTATVIQTDDGEGNVVLSRKEANDRMTWEHFRQLLDERTPLEVTISEVVNGGAVAMVEGVRGFIPASRLDAAYVEDLDSWNGKKIPVLVIEADEEKKRLVLSGRELAREKQDAEKKSRIARCETGAIMEGTVETIKPYVDEFISFAKTHPELKFYVTRIGCGIAGFKDEEIAPLFQDAFGVDNIILPKSFADIIEPKFPFDIASFEDAINWTLPGIQLFYRDTNVAGDLDKLAEVYRNRNIIRAGFFIDCTSRAAKLVKNVRFIIASAHAAAIWQVMGDEEAEQWRLNVLDFNSYFKVVDTYCVGDQLQILLLHIPLRGIPMFAGMGNINIGEDLDLIKIARKSFDDKSKMQPLPWLETEAWNQRTDMLPGTCAAGWASLELQEPNNEQVANLHNAILSMSHDDTDLNKPI